MLEKGTQVRVIADYAVSGVYYYDKTGKIVDIERQSDKDVYVVELDDYTDIRFVESELKVLSEDNSSIGKCILNVWNEMPEDSFKGIELVNKVKRKMNTPNRYADTILRSMRKLREDNKINFKVLDKDKSVYVKLNLKEKENEEIVDVYKEDFNDTNRIM